MDRIISFIKNRFHIFMVLVALTGLVLVLNRFSVRWDLTKNKVFTLSEVSKSLVSDLRDPLRIKVFISKNLPPPLNDLPIALEDILIEYQESAHANFNYTFYNVTETDSTGNPEIEANIKLANDYGINANQVQTLDKDQIQLIKVYAGIVIEYGNLIERIPFVTDAARLEYQLTTILDRMNKKLNSLLALESPIEATLYLNDGFIQLSPLFQIQGLSGVQDTLKQVFEKVNQENYGKVNFSVVNQIQEELDSLNQQGVRIYPWNEFQSPDGRTIPAGEGVAALKLAYQDRVEWVELLSPQTSLQLGANGLQQVVRYVLPNFNNYENVVDGIINSLLDINDYIAYLEDKGTVALESGEANPFQPQGGGEGANFYRILSENYNVERITLKDLSPKYKTLVIAGAKEEFNDYELYLIDQYLMQGRSILFLQDALQMNQVPGGRSMPTWTPVENKLEKLLENYGVKIRPNYVLDKESYVSRGQGQGGGATEQQVYFAPLIQNQNINHDFVPLRNFKTFVALEMSPVEAIQERVEAQGLTATKLFSSSANSWNQVGDPSLISMLIQPPTDDNEYKSIDLAYVLRGEFQSYFSDKPIPAEPQDSEGEAQPKKASGKSQAINLADSDLILKKSKPAKIMVVGSSALIKNNLIDERGESVNANLAINLVDYLSDREDWTVMRTKDQRLSPLEPYNPEAAGLTRWLTHRGFMKWFNILGLPIVVVLVGLAVYGQRSSRRRKIAQLFSENQDKD